MRANYKLPEVALLVTRFAAVAVATQRRRSATFEAQLADIENALSRMPQPLYEALTLRGLERFTNLEAAQKLHVHVNTMSRRYMRGLRWLHEYLNAPRPIRQLRSVDWQEWAWANADNVVEAFEETKRPGSGRPPEIAPSIDKRVLELHCMGATEREIARTLNDEFKRDGLDWTRSSVRSVLRRYNAPKRPSGPRPHPLGSYRVTRSDYREITFGERLCDPNELLQRNPRSS